MIFVARKGFAIPFPSRVGMGYMYVPVCMYFTTMCCVGCNLDVFCLVAKVCVRGCVCCIISFSFISRSTYTYVYGTVLAVLSYLFSYIFLSVKRRRLDWRKSHCLVTQASEATRARSRSGVFFVMLRLLGGLDYMLALMLWRPLPCCTLDEHILATADSAVPTLFLFYM